ncbi:hypothetical protein Pla123a_25220 [Posidoniimonas polymericola]|uniref:Activator of Hsp90 ATPase homologue 1/2-like C-terminal domain-containing protein n=1 Tax=Posidoniimonas polymericola TaxID=2528002 RepID=A0A5C5YQ53_9BACT|nr:SRPBCC family protein [Posidoniimonas polymericola]TWT77092.1 hypothetical protein Pla123a_25220 [Posidoniimonas polymericola]
MPPEQKATDEKANEIYINRVYDAPVALVWDAWTDPEQVAQWWGPRGFTITTHSKDLRPGGHWSYTMHGPDGTDYENRTLYYEVVEHEKLVYDHGGNDDRPPLFRVTVLFFKEQGQTRMEMTFALETAEAAAEIKKMIKQANGNSTWDRLAEYVEKQQSGDEVFVINRTVEAPIDAVFAAWTDPQQLAAWLPPAGFQMEFAEADIRAGGSARNKMFGDQRPTIYACFEYLEVEPPTRIAYTQSFCDEQGSPGRHPMSPEFPATLLTSISLAAETPNRTRVTVASTPQGARTAAELQAFTSERTGMTMGWTGSFDNLEQRLAGESTAAVG